MLAGRLKYRITLLKPVPAVAVSGDDTPAFAEVRTVWAERVKISGRRSEEVGEHFPDYRVEFNIRDAHPVEEGWRVRLSEKQEYAVSAIVPNIDRGMLTLICERVNP